MPNRIFPGDSISRMILRCLLILQLAAVVLVLGLNRLDLYMLGMGISFLTLTISLAVLLWLYLRYQNLPLVRQKRELERLVFKFQKKIQSESQVIQTAIQERNRLFQAEKDELHTAISKLQREYIEQGLASALLKDAAIPGVGPKLKEKLAGYGIRSAAHVNNGIAQLPGFGDSKRQALVSWRSTVMARLESTKPASLPPEQLQAIKQKYHPLHDANNAKEKQAITSKQILEHEFSALRPRLQYLAPVTFPGYLSNALASRGVIAAGIAFVLIGTQVVSSVSATGSAIMASVPTATATQTATVVPSQTSMPTETYTPTMTSTATVTDTSTITSTSTITFTATITNTPRPTSTSRPRNTATLAPPSLGDGGGSTGNCDPAYPGVCIPPRPPDLDCKQVPYTNFTVLPPDPHGFDRDADGVGCEG
jgi:hypothetical protein